jgi:hypothetical protein
MKNDGVDGSYRIKAMMYCEAISGNNFRVQHRGAGSNPVKAVESQNDEVQGQNVR